MFTKIGIKAPVVVHGNFSPNASLASLEISENCRVLLPGVPSALAFEGYVSTCWLDGCVVLGDSALLNSSDLASAMNRLQLGSAFAEYWGTEAKSSGAAYIFDSSNGTVDILPDPLGGCSVFCYENSGITLLSSDLKSLVDVAKSMSITLEKNILFQLERITLGVGSLSGSPYHDVRIIDQFKYLQISDVGVTEKRYGSFEFLMDDSISLGELFLRARSDILNSVTAISDATSTRKVAHITGGFDSRLVAASLVESDRYNEYEFFCSGPAGTSDRIIADGLSATFNLKRTWDSGLRAEPTSSVEEKFLLPMVESAGISMTGPTGSESLEDVVVLGGGYGELLRSFYSKLAPDFSLAWEPSRISRAMYGSHVFASGGLMRDRVSDELTRSLKNRLVSLSDLGFPLDFVGDAYYSSSRNRLHIGQNAMLWSRYGHRFDPLYSVAGLAMARKLPVVARDANIIGFDLMASFQGNLENFPFDSERRNANYHNMRRQESLATFSSHEPLFIKTSTPSKGSSKPASIVDPEIRKSNIKRANDLGVNFWQINDLKETQQGIRELFGSVEWANVDAYLDRDYVERISQGDLSKRQQIRDVHSVYSTLLWWVNG